jgi:hypothetical protein
MSYTSYRAVSANDQLRVAILGGRVRAAKWCLELAARRVYGGDQPIQWGDVTRAPARWAGRAW